MQAQHHNPVYTALHFPNLTCLDKNTTTTHTHTHTHNGMAACVLNDNDNLSIHTLI